MLSSNTLFTSRNWRAVPPVNCRAIGGFKFFLYLLARRHFPFHLSGPCISYHKLFLLWNNIVCKQMILECCLLQGTSLYISVTAWHELLSLGIKAAAILPVINSLCYSAVVIADLRLALGCELEFLLRRNINETKLNSSAVCNWNLRQSAFSFKKRTALNLQILLLWFQSDRQEAWKSLCPEAVHLRMVGKMFCPIYKMVN